MSVNINGATATSMDQTQPPEPSDQTTNTNVTAAAAAMTNPTTAAPSSQSHIQSTPSTTDMDTSTNSTITTVEPTQPGWLPQKRKLIQFSQSPGPLLPSAITTAADIRSKCKLFDESDQIYDVDDVSGGDEKRPSPAKGGRKKATTTGSSKKKQKTSHSTTSASPTRETAALRIPGLGIVTGKSELNRVTKFGYASFQQGGYIDPNKIIIPDPIINNSNDNQLMTDVTSTGNNDGSNSNTNDPSTSATATNTLSASGLTTAKTATGVASSTAPNTTSTSSTTTTFPNTSYGMVRRIWQQTNLRKLFTPIQLYTFVSENDRGEFNERVTRRQEAKREAEARSKDTSSNNTTSSSSTTIPPPAFRDIMYHIREQAWTMSTRYYPPSFPCTGFRSGSAFDTLMNSQQQARGVYEAMVKKETAAHAAATARAQQSLERVTKNALTSTAPLIPFPPPLILPPPPLEYKISLTLHLYQHGFSLNGGEGDKNFHLYSPKTADFLRSIDQGEIPGLLGVMLQPQTNTTGQSGPNGFLNQFHFYDGFLFCAIKDYRSITNQNAARSPVTRHILLRPTPESLTFDTNLLAMEYSNILQEIVEDEQIRIKPETTSIIEPDNGIKKEPLIDGDTTMTDVNVTSSSSSAALLPSSSTATLPRPSLTASEQDDLDASNYARTVLALESSYLRQTKHQLCLDPSPRVMQVANLLSFNVQRPFVKRLTKTEAKERSLEMLKGVGEIEEMMASPPAGILFPIRDQMAYEGKMDFERALHTGGFLLYKPPPIAPGTSFYEFECPGIIEPLPTLPPAPLSSHATPLQEEEHQAKLHKFLYEKTTIYPLISKSSPNDYDDGQVESDTTTSIKEESKESIESVLTTQPELSDEQKSRAAMPAPPVEYFVSGAGGPPVIEILKKKDPEPFLYLDLKKEKEMEQWLEPQPLPPRAPPAEVTSAILNFGSFIHRSSNPSINPSCHNIAASLLNQTLQDPIVHTTHLGGKNFAIMHGIPPHVWGEPSPNGIPVIQPFLPPEAAANITNLNQPIPPPPSAVPPAPPVLPQGFKKNPSIIHISSQFPKVAPGDRPVHIARLKWNEWQIMQFISREPPPKLRTIQEVVVHPISSPPMSRDATPDLTSRYSVLIRTLTQGESQPHKWKLEFANEERIDMFMTQFKRMAIKDSKTLTSTKTITATILPEMDVPPNWWELGRQPIGDLSKPTAAYSTSAGGALYKSGGPTGPPGPGGSYPPQAQRGVYPSTSSLPPNTMPQRPSTGGSAPSGSYANRGPGYNTGNRPINPNPNAPSNYSPASGSGSYPNQPPTSSRTPSSNAGPGGPRYSNTGGNPPANRPNYNQQSSNYPPSTQGPPNRPNYGPSGSSNTSQPRSGGPNYPTQGGLGPSSSSSSQSPSYAGPNAHQGRSTGNAPYTDANQTRPPANQGPAMNRPAYPSNSYPGGGPPSNNNYSNSSNYSSTGVGGSSRPTNPQQSAQSRPSGYAPGYSSNPSSGANKPHLTQQQLQQHLLQHQMQQQQQQQQR